MPPVLIQDNAERFGPAGSTSAIESQDTLLLEELPSIGDEARKRNVVLVLEPVNRYESEYLNTLAHAAQICEVVGHPNVGVTCDFYHMQLEELDVEKSIANATPWIRHVHVAENTRVEPGPGSMDFRSGFSALKKHQYQGIIEIECRTLSGPAEAVLPRSAEYLRSLWMGSI
jgi:sugar phosphate isomerase/epimerase